VTHYERTTRARSTGATILTGYADDLGLDPGWSDYEQRFLTQWYNWCETHGCIVGHQTLALARSFASVPEEWCEGCQEVCEARDESAGITRPDTPASASEGHTGTSEGILEARCDTRVSPVA
jgi:hypothetical protein